MSASLCKGSFEKSVGWHLFLTFPLIKITVISLICVCACVSFRVLYVKNLAPTHTYFVTCCKHTRLLGRSTMVSFRHLQTTSRTHIVKRRDVCPWNECCLHFYLYTTVWIAYSPCSPLLGFTLRHHEAHAFQPNVFDGRARAEISRQIVDPQFALANMLGITLVFSHIQTHLWWHMWTHTHTHCFNHRIELGVDWRSEAPSVISSCLSHGNHSLTV